MGGAWGTNGTLVAGQGEGGLLQMSEDGGGMEPLTALARDEVSHRLPSFLPDDKGVLFTIRKSPFNWNSSQIAVLSLETGERKVLIENGADARYAPSGHQVFVRMGVLMAAPFDLERLEVTGLAVPMIEGVRQSLNAGNTRNDTGVTLYRFSNSGTLVYVPGSILSDSKRSLVWVDRQGDVTPLEVPKRPYGSPRVSPDGQRILFHTAGLEKDVWVFDMLRGNSTRLTFEGSDLFPLWLGDSQLAFSSDRAAGASFDIYRMGIDSSEEAEKLTASESYRKSPFASSWSTQDQALAFVRESQDSTLYDIWVLSSNGNEESLVDSKFVETHPTFSPDGRWLAYGSNESGRTEIYGMQYPPPGGKYQVSTEGGSEPAWSRTGRELFYRTDRGTNQEKMMVVEIATEPSFRAEPPRVLFEGRFSGSGPMRAYDVHPDGQRFIMSQLDPEPPGREHVTEINLILNWFEELKERAPIP